MAAAKRQILFDAGTASANGSGGAWREQTMRLLLTDAPAVTDTDVSPLRIVAAARERGKAAATVTSDRTALLRFASRETQNARPLITIGWAQGVNEDGGANTAMRFGWIGGDWEGELIEIVFPPLAGADCVVIAESAAVLHRFVVAAVEWAERPLGRALIYNKGHWKSAPELDAVIGHTTWDDVILAPAMIADVRRAVEGWQRGKATFARFGFPWRRGILFIGPPGTGKTMLCKATAAALPDLPFLYVQDMASHQGVIQAIFQRARRIAPCILAFEDIDALVSEGQRAQFLNELDGFASNDGLLVIASSNHPERIDEALLKRPSRFDRVYHIGLPEPPERAEFCARTLTRLLSGAQSDAHGLDIADLSLRIAEKTDGFTPAYLKEALLSTALTFVGDAIDGDAAAFGPEFAPRVFAEIETLREHLKRMNAPADLAAIPGRSAAPMGLRRGGRGRDDDD